MNYLLNWLQTHFRLVSFRNDEALISCPSCGKNKLYFNITKKVGTCHYSGCMYHSEPVTIKKLTNICGFAPDEAINFSLYKNFNSEVPQLPQPINLPEGAEPLVIRKEGQLFTIYPTVLKHIQMRGITPEEMFRYNFHFDGMRIYIPVYHNGQMVQWVGRAAWWFANEEKKYKYATGSSVTNYLFNWDTNKYSNKLTLVENTFVAIASDTIAKGIDKNSGWCSTFGSHLSDTQCDLIGKGAACSVVVIFDSDAQDKAEKGVQKLRGLGIRAGMISLVRRQPDDYSPGVLTREANEIHRLIKNNYQGQWAFRLNQSGILEDL